LPLIKPRKLFVRSKKLLQVGSSVTLVLTARGGSPPDEEAVGQVESG